MMALGRGGRRLRIAYGRIFHEACAYSPVTTQIEDFRRMHHMEGEELSRAVSWRGAELEGYMPHAELTGFAAAARLAGDVESVPLVSSLAVPNGPLSAECFETLVSGLEQRLQDAGPLDGIYLALHGSMQVVGLSEAPEAVILRRVRAATHGPVRIAVSYDLHAHITPGLVDPVDVLVGYRSNPHWDLFPTGFRAGNRLIRTLRGEIEPVHAWRKLPMVLGGGTSVSFFSPMRQVFRFMKRLERNDKVLSASLFMVHPFTDSDQLGWAAHVSTDGDPALAAELADQLADQAWAQRKVEIPPLLEVDPALDQIADRTFRLHPVSLIDVDDIVGAGAPGGSTHVIRSLVERDRDLVAYIPLHDPAAVDELWTDALGATHDVILTGTPGYGQPQVPVCGMIAAKREDEFGRTIRLDCGKLRLALTDQPPLPVHPQFWRRLGLNPRRADLLVQKNFFHYRMFYALTSFTHIAAVSEGATSLDRVRSRDYRRPTWPQADPLEWREAPESSPELTAPREEPDTRYLPV